MGAFAFAFARVAISVSSTYFGDEEVDFVKTK
jgi:hypothetical protein